MLNLPAPIPSPAPAGFAEIFDAAAVAAELEQLPALRSGNELELRTAVAQKLKAALMRGRAVVERMLLRDRRGRLCADPSICGVLIGPKRSAKRRCSSAARCCPGKTRTA